jgi:glycosyltransferase involved in cell wall biosynthesis
MHKSLMRNLSDLDTMKNKKRVLIITYYWPPAGGSGVQRHLKFVKYLRLFGWEPIVFTVANGEYPELDSSLIEEIPPDTLTLKSWTLEPYLLFKALTKNRQQVDANLFHSGAKKGVVGRGLFWIRSNIFIPDARILWAIPSFFKLSAFLQKEKVHAIISTGPPHTAHIIGRLISRRFNIPWLVDFRDPWTKIDYFDKLNLSNISRGIHERLERNILRSADCVVTVSPYHANELSKISNSKVNVITNGFDEEDFSTLFNADDKRFSIVHTGMLSESRNHDVFWNTIAELALENGQFHDALEIRLYGKTDAAVRQSIPAVLANKVFIYEYTNHTAIPAILRKAQVLYLPIHNCAVDIGFLPGKLFEYLAVRRPILSIGPLSGDTASLLRGLKAGETVSYDQKVELKKYLLDRFHAFQQELPYITNANLDQFTRRKLTERLADLLNQISN